MYTVQINWFIPKLTRFTYTTINYFVWIFKWCYCNKITRYEKLWNTFYFWTERMIYEDWMRYLKKLLERELWVFELRKISDHFKHEKNLILQFQWRCNSFWNFNLIINLNYTSYIEIMKANTLAYNSFYFLNLNVLRL